MHIPISLSRIAMIALFLIVWLSNCNAPVTPTSGNLPTTQLETTPTIQLETTPIIVDPTPTISSSSATPVRIEDEGDAQEVVFSAPGGRWRIRYPGDRLTQESLGNDLTIFISADRGTFAAVDSFMAEGDAYGNTGENLRNRARDTLERIYGRPVIEEDIIAFPPKPWATGISFMTERGSKGVALYRQPGRGQGDYQVYGFLYGYKAANEADALPMLQAIMASLEMNGERTSDANE